MINILVLPHRVSYKDIRSRAIDLAEELAKCEDFNVYMFVRALRKFQELKYELGNIFAKPKFAALKEGRLTYIKVPYIPWLLQYNEKYLRKLIQDLDINVIINEFSYALPIPVSDNLIYIYDLVDDYGMFHSLLVRRIINKYLKKEIRKSSLTTVQTITLGEIAKARGWLNDFLWLPSGTDVSAFQNVSIEKVESIKKRYNISDKLVIGHIGYQNKRSGINFIIDVFKQAKKLISNLALMIVGPGPEAEKLHRIYENNEDIIFVGSINRSEVPSYFLACDIGVLPYEDHPSVEAGFPLRLIDFCAACKVVISWPFGDLKYLNFPNVILIKRSVSRWVDAIIQAKDICWQKEWDTVTQGFSWSNITDKLKSYIRHEFYKIKRQ